jgi:hypothetical protein
MLEKEKDNGKGDRDFERYSQTSSKGFTLVGERSKVIMRRR